MQTLRDNNQCFECEQTGHMAKDCPKRHTLSHRPGSGVNSLRSNAVDVDLSPAEVRLAALEEGSALGLFGITPMHYGLPTSMAVAAAQRTKGDGSDDDGDEDGPHMPVATNLSVASPGECRSIIENHALATLHEAVPLLLDELDGPWHDPFSLDRFRLLRCSSPDTYLLIDSHQCDEHIIYYDQLCDPTFDLVAWLVDQKLSIYDQLVRQIPEDLPPLVSEPESNADSGDDDGNDGADSGDDDGNDGGPNGGDDDGNDSDEGMPPLLDISGDSDSDDEGYLYCGVMKAPPRPMLDLRALERSAARPKTAVRILPKLLVVLVHLNSKPCRALLDSGSLADFVSTTIVDQLKLKYNVLEKPLPLQLAVSGSRSVVKASTTMELKYQDISASRVFDIANLDTYDVILGMPFLFQHQVLLGFNPSEIKVWSVDPLPIRGASTQVLEVRTTGVGDELEHYRAELRQYAASICKEASETPLPPLRAINHVIPLIDDTVTYSWRQSRCPEALRPLWRAKRDNYIQSGRWEFFSGTNAVPMIMMQKPSKDGTIRLRTVLDTRQRNTNTKKLASPLPDIDIILHNVSSHKYRSLLDGKDAYEQICVTPEHVPRTLFATPDGTMISHVMQIGDCNAGATYQSLMNHIFSPFIGIFMDV